MELSEVTLSCNKEDLDKIIEFLKSVREGIEEDYADAQEHWHYRDYNDSWTEGETDLIVFIDNAKD